MKRTWAVGRERWKIINEALQTIIISNRNGSHLNCIRLSNAASEEHNKKIIEICLEFLRTNTPFMTEAIFHNGYRADLINCYTHEVMEIMVTETDESIENKISKYPDLFKIVKVRV